GPLREACLTPTPGPLFGPVRQHGPDLMLLGFVHQRAVAQVALPLGRLLGQDVALASAVALEVPFGSLAKALLRSGIALHFGHQPLLPLRAGLYTTGPGRDLVFFGVTWVERSGVAPYPGSGPRRWWCLTRHTAGRRS